MASPPTPRATKASHLPSGDSASCGVGSVACGLAKTVWGGDVISNFITVARSSGDVGRNVAMTTAANSAPAIAPALAVKAMRRRRVSEAVVPVGGAAVLLTH